MEPKKDTIEAGIVSNMLKKLGKLFGDAFVDTLKDLDKEIKDVRRNTDGGILGTKFCEDPSLRPYRVKFDDIEIHDDGTAEGSLSFQDPSGEVYPNVITLLWKKKDVENPDENVPEQEDNEANSESDSNFAENNEESSNNQITNKDIAAGNVELVNRDEFDAVIDKFENTVMTRFPIESSINIKLKKIVGSDETTIDLIGLSTTQPSTVALTNLNSVLDDDEFVACLPENEECNYSICDNGNDLIVDEYTDELTPATDIDILNILLSNLVVEQRNIEFILNNLQNKYDVLQTSSSLDGICWQIDDDIKDISDYIKVCGGTVPNLGTLVSNDPYIENVSSDPVMIKQTILECLNSIVNSYKLYGICISTPEINSAIQDKLLRLESMMLTI